MIAMVVLMLSLSAALAYRKLVPAPVPTGPLTGDDLHAFAQALRPALAAADKASTATSGTAAVAKLASMHDLGDAYYAGVAVFCKPMSLSAQAVRVQAAWASFSAGKTEAELAALLFTDLSQKSPAGIPPLLLPTLQGDRQVMTEPLRVIGGDLASATLADKSGFHLVPKDTTLAPEDYTFARDTAGNWKISVFARTSVVAVVARHWKGYDATTLARLLGTAPGTAASATITP